MKPTRSEIRKLIKEPEYYADEMTVSQIDKVVAGFMSVRYEKQRWLK
jgi:hypothetical protein